MTHAVIGLIFHVIRPNRNHEMIAHNARKKFEKDLGSNSIYLFYIVYIMLLKDNFIRLK